MSELFKIKNFKKEESYVASDSMESALNIYIGSGKESRPIEIVHICFIEDIIGIDIIKNEL